uniref:Major capsid protein n=1 Tax=Virus NIOZ-UU159 TaxID=2763270 RepID=A0A7S9XH44_9VIRU|nr:MAG: major capsid protein [Virus NIOZ-UU159]
MGGGLLQLVAYGAQDVYLTGNPQITFFKVVYRRHTNFAIEAIQQTPTGSNSLGSRASFQITRNGDLIHRVYFNGKIKNNNADDPSKNVALVPNFGQKLLKTVELEIGGQRIDKHYSEWLYIWNELSLPAGKRSGYNTMVGANDANLCTKLAAQSEYELYVPLEFWFCRNVGLALPLIALQYHEVKINVEYESAANLVDVSVSNLCEDEDGDGCTNGNMKATDSTAAFTVDDGSGVQTAVSKFATGSAISLSDANLWVDYVFLDTDERRRFAQLSHEYLIEQLQFTGTDTMTSSASADSMKPVRLNFNHPCKELIWAVKKNNTGTQIPFWNNFSTAESENANTTANNYSNSSNPTMQAKIMLNGNDRFATRKGDYFSLVQPYQHHENTPNENHNGINVYSFALKPEEHQPSGTLNMSRIDTAVLSLSSSVAGTIHVYAVNYNVLRILSGMGGLAYSN